VLDLTRVIAGPVGTRALAQLGADVLRVDPPVPAEIRWQHLDSGQGKRTALLDLRDSADRKRAQELLDAADVLVTGYRPGAIEALGLRLPGGVVHARVNAWGDDGPWAGRRGFDSIVQAACGIADAEGTGGVPAPCPPSCSTTPPGTWRQPAPSSHWLRSAAGAGATMSGSRWHAPRLGCSRFAVRLPRTHPTPTRHRTSLNSTRRTGG
jgi:crotonobetainyl-CoA:carnitine CoA-transferase CaiB-like acyl-CoA transferase